MKIEGITKEDYERSNGILTRGDGLRNPFSMFINNELADRLRIKKEN